MSIHIRETADPLSRSVSETASQSAVAVAQSDASRILQQQLQRYCKGQLRGRSFLIAGHRGAGKTTMVADALGRMPKEDAAGRLLMRPLPVFLHGPGLFGPSAEGKQAGSRAASAGADGQSRAVDGAGRAPGAGAGSGPGTGAGRGPGAGSGESAVDNRSIREDAGINNSDSTSGGANNDTNNERATGGVGNGRRGNDNDAANIDPTNGGAASRASNGNNGGNGVGAAGVSNTSGVGECGVSFAEEQAKLVLVQIILGLQRAVAKEYALAYRRRMLRLGSTQKPMVRPTGADHHELAAQFEMELFENPPAARLREFWVYADALENGVLFDAPRVAGQGALELLALNGICNAHQRISGDMTEKTQQSRRGSSNQTANTAVETKLGDVAKPIAALLGGSVAAAGTVAGGHSLGLSALVGVLTALAASVTFKRSSGWESKRERQLDMIFIPDLTLRTLDRVLPTLLDRLCDAGLAPVLVIDEMDKVPTLPQRIEGIIRYLKQLMADRVFSCFLTDRGYLEYLRINGRQEAYGRAYSYFSQPLLIAFQPVDLSNYLSELLTVSEPPPSSSDPAPAGGTLAVQTNSGGEDRLDLEVLKWVLRHRSQLHALALARELAAIHSETGEVSIAAGAVRTEYPYRIDITLQVAIELQLCAPQVLGWRMQRPEMLQCLFDALYYLTRGWLAGETSVDLSEAGREAFERTLVKRMNLEDLDPGGADLEGGASRRLALSPDDLRLLFSVVEGMVGFLSESNTPQAARANWQSAFARAAGRGVVLPEQSVLDALLLGKDSLLVVDPASSGTRFRWRYWASGTARDLTELTPEEVSALMVGTKEAVQFIRTAEQNLWRVFRRPSDPAEPDGAVYRMLAERTRVLSTTPAWTQVRDAITNFELVQQRQGNSGRLRQDCGIIGAFSAMVKSAAETIASVVEVAAFLGGLREVAVTNPVSEGMDVLSVGLHFAATDADGVRAATEAAGDDLDALFPESRVDSRRAA